MRTYGSTAHINAINMIRLEKIDMQQPTTDQLRLANNEIKESENKQDIALKCLIISRRIIAGDKVPVQDHRFLQKHDPELYGKSILMRVHKQDPHEYKQISDDESGLDSIDGSGHGSDPAISITGTASPSSESPNTRLDIQI